MVEEDLATDAGRNDLGEVVVHRAADLTAQAIIIQHDAGDLARGGGRVTGVAWSARAAIHSLVSARRGYAVTRACGLRRLTHRIVTCRQACKQVVTLGIRSRLSQSGSAACTTSMQFDQSTR